jgi:iron(III) transport system permease protein
MKRAALTRSVSGRGPVGSIVRAAVGTGVVAVVVAVVVSALIPLLVLVGAVLGLPTQPTLAHVRALLEPANLTALGETVVVAGGGAAIATVLGVALAVLLERTRIVAADALAAVCALPLAIPPYLMAFSYRAAFDDRVGLLPWPARAFVDVDSRLGIAVVLGVSFLPLVFLRMRAAVRAVDGALEEAARISGAGPLRALWTISIPLTLPTMVGSSALVFVAGCASYGVPALLGLAAEPPVVVLTTRMATSLQSGAPLSEALGLSVSLAALAGVAFSLSWLFGRGVAVVGGKGQAQSVVQLGAARWPVSLVCWCVAATLVVVPLAALLLQGITLRAGYGLGLNNVGLHHVVDVVGRPDVRTAAATSAVLATLAASIIVVVAVIVVLARRRQSGAGAVWMRFITSLMELAYALPGSVIAIALILSFSQPLRIIVLERATITFAVGGTVALLLIAYVIKEAALGLRAVAEALDQVHPSLEESARIAGASPTRAFVDVTLPLLRPHLLAAFVAIALPCFTELTMSVLLQAPGISTLGVILFSLYEYGDPQEAMALAALLVTVALAGHVLLAVVRRRAERARAGRA